MDELQPLMAQRLRKIDELKKEGVELFPNDFRAEKTTEDLVERFGQATPEELAKIEESFSVAGRIMSMRDFGKAAFIHIQDRNGRIQVYVRGDRVGKKAFSVFRKMDVGDFMGVTGTLFRTKTNELTIDAQSIRLLTKSMGEGHLRQTGQDYPVDQAVLGCTGFSRSGDSHDATHSGRGDRPPL